MKFELDTKMIYAKEIGMFPLKGIPPLIKGDKIFIVTCRTEEFPKWHGVYSLQTQNQFKKDNRYDIKQLSESPFVIESLILDALTQEQSITFTFMPAGALEPITQIRDKADIVTGGLESVAWKELTRLGLSISSPQLQLLQEYIRHASDVLPQKGVIPIVQGSKRSGWVGDEYTAPGWGTKKAPEFTGYIPDNGAWEQKGNRDLYFKTFESLYKDNGFFRLIAGFYAFGYLMDKIEGAENLILSILGDSTLGKTTAMKIAQAMQGDPSAFATFYGTEDGLKSLMNQKNDGCLAIDEIGTTDMTEAQRKNFIYDLSSGKIKTRLTKKGGSYFSDQEKPYKFTILMTGEESLLLQASADGQVVRYVEIVFDAEKIKLWETIDSGEEADEYLNFFKENHGWLAPLLITLIKNEFKKYQQVYSKCLTELNKDQPNSKIKRKNKIFASAFTGNHVIHDALGLKFDHTLEMFFTNVLANRDVTSLSGVSFLDVFFGLENSLKDHLYLVDKTGYIYEKPRRSVIGQLQQNKDRIIFTLLKSQETAFAKKTNIDFKRFLTWANDEKYLQTYANGPKHKKRRLHIPQTVGNSKSTAYRFIIPTQADFSDF